jgi:hypothetical protein
MPPFKFEKAYMNISAKKLSVASAAVSTATRGATSAAVASPTQKS